MKVQPMIMMHEGCEMNEKMKLKPKTKENATKHKVNMTCQDEEIRYRPMHDKGNKGVCKMQCMTKAWKMHMWGKMC